ncbi:hypothetical protein MAPG_06653 [Magnaporthiopsis poae ATCC 64411]|uniref:Uncharacterized protein n=1 Tax=Magnaporthiopsis poae (strain ATCC 64411 / 73-15) TaxID=644358 RepID=A0A0C4E2L2_MAGP6|nr:hypothetical protein MAPG_06653 [Magnaporthiopsis poae ATCC 64411]
MVQFMSIRMGVVKAQVRDAAALRGETRRCSQIRAPYPRSPLFQEGKGVCCRAEYRGDRMGLHYTDDASVTVNSLIQALGLLTRIGQPHSVAWRIICMRGTVWDWQDLGMVASLPTISSTGSPDIDVERQYRAMFDTV